LPKPRAKKKVVQANLQEMREALEKTKPTRKKPPATSQVIHGHKQDAKAIKCSCNAPNLNTWVTCFRCGQKLEKEHAQPVPTDETGTTEDRAT